MLNAENECYYITLLIQNRVARFYPAILNSVKAISPIKNEFCDFKQIKSPAETELYFLIFYNHTSDFMT